MNAKEISDATLESVTPADNDLMLIYDTSEGTTGKATIADIVQKGASSPNFALNTPLIKRQNNDIEGGQIDMESGGNVDITNVFIDVYENTLRMGTTLNNELRIFKIDFKNKTTSWD